MTTWLVQHFIFTAILAVVIAVVCRLIRIRPAIRHVLWLLVLVRLLMPPVVAWPWTPAGLLERLSYDHNAPATESSARDDAAAAAPQATLPFLRLIGAAPADPAPPIPVSPSLMTYYGWKGFAGVWVLGAICIAGLQMVRLVRFRRLVRACVPAPDSLRACAEDLARRFGIKTPALLISSQAGSAITWSVGRPEVIVPESLLETMNPDDLRVILAHEFAHLKRRDHWAGWIELLAGCVWWWNPVFWYARKRLRESAEMACDAWVVWALPE